MIPKIRRFLVNVFCPCPRENKRTKTSAKSIAWYILLPTQDMVVTNFLYKHAIKSQFDIKLEKNENNFTLKDN